MEGKFFCFSEPSLHATPAPDRKNSKGSKTKKKPLKGYSADIDDESEFLEHESSLFSQEPPEFGAARNFEGGAPSAAVLQEQDQHAAAQNDDGSNHARGQETTRTALQDADNGTRDENDEGEPEPRQQLHSSKSRVFDLQGGSFTPIGRRTKTLPDFTDDRYKDGADKRQNTANISNRPHATETGEDVDVLVPTANIPDRARRTYSNQNLVARPLDNFSSDHDGAAAAVRPEDNIEPDHERARRASKVGVVSPRSSSTSSSSEGNNHEFENLEDESFEFGHLCGKGGSAEVYEVMNRKGEKFAMKVWIANMSGSGRQ